MQFFIPMQPPTTTHNAKQLHAFMRGGKPCAVLHDSPELKATRAKLHAYLAPYLCTAYPLQRPGAAVGQVAVSHRRPPQ